VSTPDESQRSEPSGPPVPPRPQYGEYATPEEQRARIQQPDATGIPAPGLGGAGVGSAAAAPYAPHPPTGPATTAAAQPTRRADRIITFALLAYGLITVVTSVPQMLDFAGFAETWMDLVGISATFTNVAEGQTWGRVAAAVFAGGWILTALLSWRSLSRRRVSWWIPLVGAIVTFVAASVCLVVPLLGDPAVAEHFGRLG